MLPKTYFGQISSLLLLAMLQTGCSVSYSLEKSSDSVSTSLDSITSISTSSSASSNGEDEKVEEANSLYEEDIAALTVLYVRQAQNSESFQRQITSIAQNHGINNWEQEESTFLAMGKGLQRTGISKKAITSTPYFQALAATPHYDLVLEGYQD